MHFTSRLRRIALLALFALPVLALPVLAWMTGLSTGGPAWLLVVPAIFVLGCSYGRGETDRHPARDIAYGVGAALAGFAPRND